MWAFVRRIKVREHERALLFCDRVFQRVLRPGVHWLFDPLRKLRADVVSVREVWLNHADLDVIARTGALRDEARVVDLADHDRAVVWVNGRVEAVLKPGRYALWTVFHDVRVEVFDARAVRLEREDVQVIAAARGAVGLLEAVFVEAGHVGLFFKDGRFEATLGPGAHGVWKGSAKARVLDVDLREQLLADKDAVAKELDSTLGARVAPFGLEVVSLGVRDVILPGEIKELMNKVVEAQKAAEAHLITRREETAAMRNQANTARLLEANPTLMRLRELEVLEKVAGKAKLSVVLGEGGLADRVVKLL